MRWVTGDDILTVAMLLVFVGVGLLLLGIPNPVSDWMLSWMYAVPYNR